MIILRESREAGRTVEHWMQQNIDAPDDVIKVALFAWLAMQVAAVPDNAHQSIQEDHRMRFRQFAEMTVDWPIYD